MQNALKQYVIPKILLTFMIVLSRPKILNAMEVLRRILLLLACLAILSCGTCQIERGFPARVVISCGL